MVSRGMMKIRGMMEIREIWEIGDTVGIREPLLVLYSGLYRVRML